MTFSCPELSFDEILAYAEKTGYDGVEIRTASKHRHGVEPDIDSASRKKIKEKAEKAGIAISCIATSCRFADPATRDENVKIALEHIKLAGDIGCERIRVFGGTLPEGMSREDAITGVTEALKKLGDAARKAGVLVCFETHDAWCDPAHVVAVLKKVNHPSIFANWDIMHPVRTAGKTMEEAFKVLKPWIRHTHVHDSVSHKDGGAFKPIGQGIIDHKKALELLKSINYDGFISGEWINWEPYDIHLPRELATLKKIEIKEIVK